MLSRSRQGIRIGFVGRILFALVFVAFGLGSFWYMEPVPAESGEIAPPYDMKIQPLKTEQCGRCHTRYFNLLKNDGGKHKIPCHQCHESYHNYRPGKVAYEDILPKCGTCHGEAHGPDLKKCAGCHDAHAPMNLNANRGLEQGCHACHAEADKEMKTYVTQHTELYCITCHHTRHGHVPECMECHQPHTRQMTEPECIMCHPPHKALQVVYPNDVTPETCAGCHQHAYDLLKENTTKHTALRCTKCHPEHREIIRCRECHPQTHNDDMLERFPACGRCHGVAHSLT